MPLGSPERIDDVVDALDGVLARAVREQDPIGCFAALYRTVTVVVREGIRVGAFADGDRTERLDVLFAGRFLEAWRAQREGRDTSRAWAVAFAARGDPNVLIVQHLLLGVNAHINLDLGVAAVDTVGAAPLSELREDFFRINRILGHLVVETENDLRRLSPRFVTEVAFEDHAEQRLLGFSIDAARRGAWMFANALHLAPIRRLATTMRDRAVATLGARMWHAPLSRAHLTRLVSAEEHDIGAIVDALVSIDTPMSVLVGPGASPVSP